MQISNPRRIQRLMDDPRWLAYRLDCAGGNLGMLRVPRDLPASASFLDARIANHANGQAVIPLAALDECLPEPGIPRIPRFIFHTAFCCSTLMSRALAVGGHSLGLREPLPLRDLADALRAGVVDQDRARRHARLLLRLLDRHASVTETLVIKPSNLCNNLHGALLAHPDSRALYMTGSLRAFLVSVLKKGEAMHHRLPWLLDQLSSDSDYQNRVGVCATRHLNALQYAAMIWHCQRLRLDRTLAEQGDAVQVLDQEHLLTDPASVLTRTRDWLGLPWGSEAVAQILQGRVFRTHAKEPDSPYSAKVRAAENQRIRERFGDSIEATLEWSGALLERVPVKHGVPTLPRERLSVGECRRAASF